MEIENDVIRTRPCPHCFVCGTPGEPLYQGLQDRLFGSPGRWNLKKCPNSRCGLLWLDPMPTEQDISKAYLTYYTHKQTEQVGNRFPLLSYLARKAERGYLCLRYGYKTATSFFQRFLGLFIFVDPPRRAASDFSAFYLPAKPNGFLLEVGAGSGDMLKRMELLGWRVEGVDFDRQAVRAARCKDLTLRVGTLASQGYADNRFDAIVMSHVIEHVHNPIGLLQECHRVLKYGGWLVVVTPNVSSMLHKKFERNWLSLDPPRHLHLFTRNSLHALADRTRFIELSLSTSIREANWTYLASSNIRQHGFHTWGSRSGGWQRVVGKCFQLIEWLGASFHPDLGEELVLIAEKQPKQKIAASAHQTSGA
jgi:2-polyprenyl-3-methyl-5-hydroxy-6-metoxy-1,4-benzoquinol methylase